MLDGPALPLAGIVEESHPSHILEPNGCEAVESERVLMQPVHQQQRVGKVHDKAPKGVETLRAALCLNQMLHAVQSEGGVET